MRPTLVFVLIASFALTFSAAACTTTVIEPSPAADASASDAGDGAAPKAPHALDSSCWQPAAQPCNALSGAGCAEGSVCEYASTATDIVIACVAGGKNAALGAKCVEGESGACGVGLRCMRGSCAKVCCASSECRSGESCEPFEAPLGTLGACLRPDPTCMKGGGACTKSSDCCSRDCHEDHCH